MNLSVRDRVNTYFLYVVDGFCYNITEHFSELFYFILFYIRDNGCFLGSVVFDVQSYDIDHFSVQSLDVEPSDVQLFNVQSFDVQLVNGSNGSRRKKKKEHVSQCVGSHVALFLPPDVITAEAIPRRCAACLNRKES